MPVTVTINGKAFQCEPGANVIKLAIDNGVFIPHYCWHPGLIPEGNCRMCLVKTSTSRKLEPACMMQAADKMVIETETKDVQDARKSVLEFLLANHPLDCPVCDKSGECLLQDYTYNWRGNLSRFIGIAEKTLKPTKDLSEKIRIWGNRCIVCTRCVRFYRDVVGDEQLTVVNRGDNSYIDVSPGHPIDNEMSLNVVDICPVGALINKEFLYKARVWFAKEQKTICNLCSKGCSVTATVVDNEIKRVVPKYNPDVNGHWMCDEGRTVHYSLTADKRIRKGLATISSVANAIQMISAKSGDQSLGFVISSGNTCEEIESLKELTRIFKGVKVGFITNAGKAINYKAFTIEAEKSSNRKFLEDQFGTDAVSKGLSDIEAELKSGDLKFLMIFNAIPFKRLSLGFLSLCDSLDFLAVISVTETGLEAEANFILPARSYLEKSGSFVNSKEMRQIFNEVVKPPDFSADEKEFIKNLLAVLNRQQIVPV
ncbi:MAG: (2Fe-2S)-binding protein [Planctomycetes bacterium]|nr:(2Fe-2S)-binding protein [Planctomycetota bacterium]